MRNTLEAYRAYTLAFRHACRIKDARVRVTQQIELAKGRAQLPDRLELIWQLEQLPLTEAEREVLKYYYLGDTPSWQEVADRLNYSEPRIYQLRRSALEKLDSLDEQEAHS
ncbi:MAG: helix-turn-helix transcriptional regulator [Clostridiales bacterium]|nr:helix-turn-helix transcriptional regulator [Clostridiales bacterium]